MRHVGHTITDADLVAYADHETSSVPAAQIESWLAENPADAARVEAWRKQADALRAAFGRVAVEPLPLSLSLAQPRGTRPEAGLATPDGDAHQPVDPDEPIRQVLKFEPRKQQTEQKPKRWTLALLAVVAVAMFYLVGLTGIGPSLPGFLQPGSLPSSTDTLATGEGSVQLARRAGEAHRTYAGNDPVRPGEWLSATDPSLGVFLSRRTGLRITLPDFSTMGLRLMGGRITPGELGPAAFLLFDGGVNDRIGLFIARTVSDEATAPVYREDRATGTLTWAKNATVYALTANGDQDRLMRLWRLMPGN